MSDRFRSNVLVEASWHPQQLQFKRQSPHLLQYKAERLVSLDVYRGLTIAGMILVTDPGTYSAIYWPLRHAEWNGWTPTDMIFPSFLFISGVAMTFSFAARTARGETRRQLAAHLVWRAALLIVIGVVLNGFPLFQLHTLRIPGILQRIALCYLGGGLLYLACITKTLRVKVSILAGAIFTILAGYWAALKLIPVPGFGAGRLDSLGNLPGYIDRAVFGTNHMWAYGLTPGYGVTYDPEGILSTLPALTLLLAGVDCRRVAAHRILADRGKLLPFWRGASSCCSPAVCSISFCP